MHKGSLVRMQWFKDNYLKRGTRKLKVLDIGSYDVNGSYKALFPNEEYEYCGLDMAPGPNVDVVMENPYHWRGFDDNTFDVVICGQTFEHTEFFWRTAEEISRVTKPGGFICIICPSNLREHRYPVDNYRFLRDGMIAVSRYVNLTVLHASTNMAPNNADMQVWYNPEEGADSFLIAQKPMDWKGTVDWERYKFLPANTDSLNSGFASLMDSWDSFVRLDAPIDSLLTDELGHVDEPLLHGAIIFGTGGFMSTIIERCKKKDIEILALADNAKTKIGKQIDGVTVLSPEQAKAQFPCSPVIIASCTKAYLVEMYRQLQKLKVNNIYVLASALKWQLPG